MKRRGVALLDVNVLIALFDPDHVHHDEAHDWFADHRSGGWATCPLTENGFVRTAAALSRGRELVTVAECAQALRTFTQSGDHEFWPDDVSLLDTELINVDVVVGHQQLTHVYLLALAVRRQGRLVTFDRKVARAAVKGATDAHLVIIEPA
ncbi:MAG: VapC toxin family PIN domain ribonuclease [Acidobacteria bacterium]|nr:VapC toxin family PIN domain ribonuclease [Acidobacteriota bacterium]